MACRRPVHTLFEDNIEHMVTARQNYESRKRSSCRTQAHGNHIRYSETRNLHFQKRLPLTSLYSRETTIAATTTCLCRPSPTHPYPHPYHLWPKHLCLPMRLCHPSMQVCKPNRHLLPMRLCLCHPKRLFRPTRLCLPMRPYHPSLSPSPCRRHR